MLSPRLIPGLDDVMFLIVPVSKKGSEGHLAYARENILQTWQCTG